MEKFNFISWQQRRKQWTNTGIACALGLCLPTLVPYTQAQESLVRKELNRRIADARKANALLAKGDIAYNQQDYKTAVLDYQQAFQLLPNGIRTSKLRTAAADRYATAATERSRQLAKSGRYDEAKLLLEAVLKPNIAPAHLGAIKLSRQIDDPIRYNPALTRKHVKDVQTVGMTLRKAEGYYNLGQYDKALALYRDVLRIDPFNKAARRSMEKIEATKSDYYRAAYDQTRAEMLSAVDHSWEMPVSPPVNSARLLSGSEFDTTFMPDLREKLSGITIESINLDRVSLSEALDFVRVQSRLGDAPSITGEKNGVNIVLTLGDPESKLAQAILASRVNLKARDLPLAKVLDYITDQTHTQWRSDGASILVTPLGSTTAAIITRSFKVPPNFLSSAATAESEDAEDIFGGNSSNSKGFLPKQINITEYLKQSGVNFPEGASASYSSASNTLIVRNTPDNIDIIEQLVSIIKNDEPVQVVIRTTIMRVSHEKLKALNFDWMITPAYLGGGLSLGGGTVGNGGHLLDMPLSPFSGLGSPITSGTRSGSTGLTADSIETFIKSNNSGFTNSEIRAPGILTLTGVYSGVQVQMMMRGMNQQTGADVMAKPSTIARSGERAKIEIIREFIYPTEYEPPELPNTVGGGGGGFDPITGQAGSSTSTVPITPAHPTAFETKHVGITLEVEPTVGPNKNFIELSLRPEMVEFEGFVNYGSPITGASPTSTIGNLANLGTNAFTTTGGQQGIITENNILMPVFKVTRLRDQTITIQDGATIVLGGLMTSQIEKIEDKVPILGDIPYVGRLFKSEAERTITEAVVITVQVELIDPAGNLWRNRQPRPAK